MKIELDREDIEGIAKRTRELLQPLFERKEGDQDRFFDKEGLAEYLSVTPGWVYDHARSIPHYKLKGQLRFRKSEIDAWASKNRVPVSMPFPSRLREKA